MPKEIIYEGCVAGDTPSVSWKAENPDKASTYKAEKGPLRVSLVSGEIPPGSYYLSVLFGVRSFNGEVEYGYGFDVSVTTPFGQIYKVFVQEERFFDSYGNHGRSRFSAWKISSTEQEDVYDETGKPVYDDQGYPVKRNITVEKFVGNERLSEVYSAYGVLSGYSDETFIVSAILYDYEWQIVADITSPQVGTTLKIELFNGDEGNADQLAGDEFWDEVFHLDFTQRPQDIEVDCDCESDCVKVYRNNQEEFFCICREEEDKDLTANKERIKQEVKAELFPILKEQIKSEVKPEVKSELKADDEFKNSIRDAIKTDATFKAEIRDFLLGNQEFKTGVVAFLLSDEDFKKKLIEAIEKDLDPESAGQTFETETAGIYELKIRLKNGIPNRVSIPMQTLPWEEDPIILQTLVSKYGRSFVIGNWQALNGQLVAPLS